MRKGAAGGPAGARRARWSGLPPRTIRARLALFYCSAFSISGALLLGITVGYWQSTTGTRATAASPARGPIGVLPGPRLGRLNQVAQHTSDSRQLLIAAAVALGLTVALSVAFGWLAAGRILRPLRAITSATRHISATNLHERLNLCGPQDELKELGDTFDDLLGRLERSFQLERQFVANASHELRTPLTTMRASLDVAMAKPGPPPPQLGTLARRLRRELDHIDELLESFLTLAQAQRGELADEMPVSLDRAASTALERRANAIASLRLHVEQEYCPAAWARGSPTLLGRLVENLVDNAVKHNQDGGWVHVRSYALEQICRLVVENGGAVFGQDQVSDLARPFRRLGSERTGSDKGTGLGLSIVKSIAEAHGGTLRLCARLGGGITAVVDLPMAPQPPVAVPR
ncbi:MAG TPA: HAMP domain-containing sensor histidine kinase [Acidimicrobiales bacterium]|nr:HAMP domain-containing sensor histidine kinase [Acidimicrobiales bacterium]